MQIKKRSRIFLIIAIIILASAIPFIIWSWGPGKSLNTIIMDKTVPDKEYREHKALMWVLNNLKYTQGESDSIFRYEADYYGFFPKDKISYDVKELPADLGKTDLIYIADTYGVSSEDFYQENETGKASQLLYGGLSENELVVIKNSLNKDNILIAEFNTFESPTGKAVSEQLENLLAVEWSGWTGRYFPDLSLNSKEIPSWLKGNYEEQYKKKWAFEGSGFALVSEDGKVIILRKGEEIGKGLNKIVFSKEAEGKYGVKNHIRYYYWFDVVKAKTGTEVLAEYQLDLTEKGEKALKKYGLDETFPAIIERDDEYHTYYFAGDFSDNNKVPFLYNLAGLRQLRSFLTLDYEGTQANFFWKVYNPLIKGILTDLENRKMNGGANE